MTTGDSDFEILSADGVTWVPLNLVWPRNADGSVVPGKPKTLQEALTSSDEDIEASDRLAVEGKEDFSGGMGVDYHEAPGAYTRTPGYVMPAGAATALTVTATNNSNSPIVAIRQFGADLFAAQTGDGSANSGRVMRSVDNGATWTNSLNLAAGQYVRDLISFDNGAGTQYLYASSCTAKDPDPGTNGMLHRWNGAVWTSTTAGVTYGAYSRQRMAAEFGVDQDGVGDWRLVVISGSKTVSWTKPGADPFGVSATSWVEGVRIRTGANLLRIAAARRHWWVTAGDGLYDLDEQGNTPNLTSYSDRLIHGANGLAATYKGGYVYESFGQGLDRVYVANGQVLQEDIGQCGPGQLTRARTKWTHSWTTELSQDQDWIVNAVYNPSTQEAGIFWCKDAKSLGIESRNPLASFGPEIVITGGYKVSAMFSFTPSNDDLRFFVAAFKDAAPPVLAWVSLPISGAPMDDLISSGAHRFATGTPVTLGSGTIQGMSRIHLLDMAFGDRTSNKILYQHTLNTEGLSIVDGVNDGLGTKMTLQTRADPTPGSTTFPSSVDITTSPRQDVSPSTTVQGSRLELLISFISPQGGATPPKVGVLDAVRNLAWKIAPTVPVCTLDVEYGSNVPSLSNTAQSPYSPDWLRDQLLALARFKATTIRTPNDQQWTVKVRQAMVFDTTLNVGGDFGQAVRARIAVSVISRPAAA